MAVFNYTGMARIVLAEGVATQQFIAYWADTGSLRVWPEDQSDEESEYLGHINEHPALRIQFLHWS
jgi:hypothetical protein